MKYGQSWEVFKKKNTQNIVRNLAPDPFTKNQNWAYPWINSLKFYAICFYFMPKWRSTQVLKCRPLVLTLSPCLIFGKIFGEKYFSRYILLTDPISLHDCQSQEMLVNKCSVIICLPVCEVIISKINLNFSSRFPAWPKR